MAAKQPHIPFSPRISAAGLTRFPSQLRWEEPWEPELDIRKLRAKAPAVRRPYELHAHPARPVPVDATPLRVQLGLPDSESIKAVIAELVLADDVREKLLADLELISLWYRLPEARAAVGFEIGASHDQLRQGAVLAGKLADLLGPYATEIEAFLAALPDDVTKAEHNLMGLADDARRFSQAAAAALKHIKRSGRAPDSRRNIALVLTVQAFEEATDRKIAVTRVDKQTGDPAFNGQEGRAVAKFLRALTEGMENQLVVAFERLRRKPRIKSP